MQCLPRSRGDYFANCFVLRFGEPSGSRENVMVDRQGGANGEAHGLHQTSRTHITAG